ncbi:hypothetical protein D1B17_11905 [Companilactobacillus zhachilii]|uniref:Uncharacterized protein n=1 Tax=Companilactobacillus zhachilii TaxID=2304606 RepID=A0A386PT90_9LACO|nr:hypothetical protein D1B17_11905 [Companilactobacillus zhachilii]
MEFLENLKKNNQFPIIFIGSGITQRYFSNAPTWDALLKKIWDESDVKQTYYSRYHELETKFGENTFKVYTTLADELEKQFDSSFYAEKVKLKELTPEMAHSMKISPFKTRIAEIFLGLLLNSNTKKELKSFKSMLSKARLIVTTNYDDFIEKQLNNAIKVRVGNQGLFEPAGDLNELYKIHGSVKNPNSIIITSNDYETLERTSAIVNAKILSLLTESPILFIGYSLTDKNIQSLLTDLANNMPFKIEEAAKRIGVVKYESGKNDITESMMDTEFGVHYTQLSTDNYEKIYTTISKINQGFPPSEISKYQSAIKKIIEVKGERGELKQVLTSFVNLENLPKELENKNLVVALGDNRYLYRFPDYVDYVKSYFLGENPMPTEIALKFITSMSVQSPLPISKFVNKPLSLNSKDKNKINNRLKKFDLMSKIKKTVNVPKTSKKILGTYINKTPVEILSLNDDIKANVKLAYFIKNIEEIGKTDFGLLIKYILKNKDDGFIKQTNARKLFMAYSLYTEPIVKKVD